MLNNDESYDVLLQLRKIKRKHEFVALFKRAEKLLEEQKAALQLANEGTVDEVKIDEK